MARLSVVKLKPELSLLPCKLCGGATALAMERRGYRIFGCGYCGFMFAEVDAQAASQLYTEDQFFFEGEASSERVWYDVLWERKRPFYMARLERIAGLYPVKRLLDFGCASGYMLRAAKDRGWQAVGIELSPEMRRRARTYSACTVYESLADAQAVEEKFDCILMFDVIEHLADPLGTLIQLRELLRPGGLIAISTSNCEVCEAKVGLPLDIWFVPPAHIAYFNPETLVACARRAGFEPIAFDGIEAYCKVIAGDILLPKWLMSTLALIRRGKRPLPHGALGKLIRQIYTGRLGLYRRSGCDGLRRSDLIELYAGRVG